jgi:hypothetical protein
MKVHVMLNFYTHHKHRESRKNSRKILHLPPHKLDLIPDDFYATEEITQKNESGPKIPT